MLAIQMDHQQIRVYHWIIHNMYYKYVRENYSNVSMADPASFANIYMELGIWKPGKLLKAGKQLNAFLHIVRWYNDRYDQRQPIKIDDSKIEDAFRNYLVL